MPLAKQMSDPRVAYTLIWAQMRQLSGVWTITLVLWGLCSVSAFLTEPWLGLGFWEYYSATAWLFWAAGLLLPFEEQRTNGSRFSYPVQTFTLPVSTTQVVIGVLVSRGIFVALHTLVALGTILIIDDPVLLLNLLVGSITATVYVQAAAFFMARNSILVAFAKILAWLVPVLVLSLGTALLLEIDQSRIAIAIAITLLPGVVLCFSAARYARYGPLTPERTRADDRPRSLSAARIAVLWRLPVSPLWTQTWFEFRSTAVWFPVVHLSVALPFILLLGVGYRGALEPSELQLLNGAGLGLAIAVGFLWENSSRVAIRFPMALPLSEEKIGLARAGASLVAVLLSLLGIIFLLATTFAIRAWLDHPMLFKDDVLPLLLTFLISSAPIWWAALAIGRITLLVLLACIPIISGASFAMYMLSSLTDFTAMAILFLAVPLTLAGLGRCSRKRLNTSGNWVWLVGLCLVPVALLAHFYYEKTYILTALDWAAFYFLPTMIAVASIFFARASGLMSKSFQSHLLILLVIALPVLGNLMRIQPYNAGILDSGGVAYLVAGLILPFVWFPLVARFQRTG